MTVVPTSTSMGDDRIVVLSRGWSLDRLSSSLYLTGVAGFVRPVRNFFSKL
jgi:hypothetical protein